MLTITRARGVLTGALSIGWILLAGCADRSTPADAVAPPSVTHSPTVSPSETPLPINPPAPVRQPETPVKIYNPTTLQGLSDADAAFPVHPPEVLLSAEHDATCLVKVDQPFPAVPLQTLEGEGTRLTAHLGQRLTVVVFWDGQHPMAVEQISWLNQEVLSPYSTVGVGVTAINVGDSVEDLWNLLSQIDHGFVNLRDPEREAYSQIATRLLPRTYLLDAEGEILWLDVEYSRTTRRELRNAILYHLRQQLEDSARQAEPLM